MKPIPKRLLIHTVTLHKVVKKDAWGSATLDEGTELTHVRIEPSIFLMYHHLRLITVLTH